MEDIGSRYRFPKILKITLKSFSLYTLQPIITVDFPGGVFCLAGANGLGKSTFITAVNYGLTGIVSHRKYESVEEYYKYSLSFSADFFSGRITELDRDAAEVSLDFTIGDYLYSITRGLFEPDQLRRFRICDSNCNSLIIDTEVLTPGERHREYAKSITSHIGLKTFEQFVFLQHFILTFDERRNLVFWDQKVIEQALYLAFGLDDAAKADSLRREIEKADSLVRNFNWQATEVRKKLTEMESIIDSSSRKDENHTDILEQHLIIINKIEDAESSIEQIENELKDANLKLSEISAQYTSLKSQYEEEFSNRLQLCLNVSKHPMIVSCIKDMQCALCGAHGATVVNNIQFSIQNNLCPLCKTDISFSSSQSDPMESLKETDRKMMHNRTECEAVRRTINRLTSNLEIAKAIYDDNKKNLVGFETANKNVLRLLINKKDNTGIEEILKTYRTQMNDFLEGKKEQIEIRDTKLTELQQYRKHLGIRYANAEERFVPSFKKLAYLFLGIGIDIRMETSSSRIGLTLDVNSITRRQQYQLSESQRFFVDIALRMALVQYMSDPESKGCLFIDTPEGSLDIAYESRAGDMFAAFVNNGYHIMMTANINSSRILRKLANRCGREKMSLCRMTSWTQLSEVQIAEEQLFEEAFKEIEDSMDGGEA